MYFELEDDSNTWEESHNKKAIVIVTIGEDYYERWCSISKDTIIQYADNFDYDVIVVKEKLSPDPDRSPAWQKCLVPAQDWAKNYNRLLLLDADVAINVQRAPNIADRVPIKKVGGTLNRDQLSKAEKQIWMERRGGDIDYENVEYAWKDGWHQIYELHDLDPDVDKEIQTGVLLLSPDHHADVFKTVYKKYEEKSRQYEQPFLSYELLSRNLFKKVSPRFNWLTGPEITEDYLMMEKELSDVKFNEAVQFQIDVEYDKSYFIHFDEKLWRKMK